MNATEGQPAEERKRARKGGGWWIAVPGLVLIAIVLAALIVWRLRPHLTDHEVDGVVTAAIQQESKASFLVTGTLDITAQARVENTLRLLPGLINLSLGKTTATVRAPGRVEYGFPASQITPDRITLMNDGVVEIAVPRPVVYSVSPDLSKLEIETTVGWSRMAGDSREEVQSRALTLLQDNMREQAVQYLRSSRQPDINTADAMFTMLRPVMIAAGLKDPHFRFRIGSDLVMEPRDR